MNHPLIVFSIMKLTFFFTVSIYEKTQASEEEKELGISWPWGVYFSIHHHISNHPIFPTKTTRWDGISRTTAQARGSQGQNTTPGFLNWADSVSLRTKHVLTRRWHPETSAHFTKAINTSDNVAAFVSSITPALQKAAASGEATGKGAGTQRKEITFSRQQKANLRL